MSQATQTDNSYTDDERLVSHYVYQSIVENGGPVSVATIGYTIGGLGGPSQEDVLSIIQRGQSQGIYSLGRANSGEQVIESADRLGPQPDAVAKHFGQQSGDKDPLSELANVGPETELALNGWGFHTFDDLANADPDQLVSCINDYLDDNAPPSDLTHQEVSGVTNSEIRELDKQGISNKRELLKSHPADIVDNASPTSTLTLSKVTRLQKKFEDDVDIVSGADAEGIIDQAVMKLPNAGSVAEASVQRHRERVATLGYAGAVIKQVEEKTDRVGEPLAVADPSGDISDDEAVYISDTGHNADEPVKTGLTVLEDVGYDQVPKLATDPDAGHSALPVDENGEAIAPSIPLERDLKMPLDELIAKKLARNVPVRVVGPRGSGKNYLMKYICYKTNRGYRSIDVDRSTMPQDLFGPISPNEDGKLEPKNASVKQGLLNGDVTVLNEFPVMTAGAAISLHQLLNENKIVIKSHGQEIEPHPEARIVITMNPPTREYRDSEPMNSATRGRFRSFWQGYPDTVEAEVDALYGQVNTPSPVVDEATLTKIVEVAHRTREDVNENWPTLSTRNLTIVCEHIADGASPQAALRNVIRMVAEPNQYAEDAFEAVTDIF